MIEASVPTSVPPCAPAVCDYPKWTLVVAILGSSMAFLDGSVVNVALPTMQRELRASSGEMQWVVEAYALLLAALVLVGGALGDRRGRRRMFLTGVILFAAASLGCGAAPTPLTLILARAIQGVGGALLVPGSLSLISAAYVEADRGTAIGTWSSASAIVGALGPVVGGWVVSHASWRWIFLLNVPLAALVVGLALTRVNESRDVHAEPHTDWAGAALATAGLGLIVGGLVEAPNLGGLQAPVPLAMLGGGTGLLLIFAWTQTRQRAPMVPPAMFRSRTFFGTNLLTLLLYAALGGSLFFLPFNLVQLQHYSPAAAGAALVPFILLISLLSRWAGGLVTRYGARLPLVLGPLISAFGFALLALPAKGGSYWLTFFPGVVVLGVGMGLTVAPLTAVVMNSVDGNHAGVASGVNNAIARTAGLLSVAALGLEMSVIFNGNLDTKLAALALSDPMVAMVNTQRSHLAAATFPPALPPALRDQLQRHFEQAYVAGFRGVMLTAAALAALSACTAWWYLDASGQRDPTSA